MVVIGKLIMPHFLPKISVNFLSILPKVCGEPSLAESDHPVFTKCIFKPNKFGYGVLNRNRHTGRDPVSPAYKHEMPCQVTA